MGEVGGKRTELMLPDVFSFDGVEDIYTTKQSSNSTGSLLDFMRAFCCESFCELFETRNLYNMSVIIA